MFAVNLCARMRRSVYRRNIGGDTHTWQGGRYPTNSEHIFVGTVGSGIKQMYADRTCVREGMYCVCYVLV